MKQKAAFLFGILGDIPREYKLCHLFLAKKEWRKRLEYKCGWGDMAEGWHEMEVFCSWKLLKTLLALMLCWAGSNQSRQN